MSKQKFKVGDRVVVTNAWDEVNGKIGTIVEIDGSRVPYRVSIDKPCSPYDKLVWAVGVEHVREKHPVIVITSDGKTTTATMRKGKKVIKTATAKCSDKDTFDYDEGTRIAFERLQGREPFPEEQKPKYYNGKVVCVESPYEWFTVGKVYEVVNGVLFANKSRKYPCVGEPYKDDGEVRHAGCRFSDGGGRYNFRNTFIPLVED